MPQVLLTARSEAAEMSQGQLWRFAPQYGRAPAAPVRPQHALAHQDDWYGWCVVVVVVAAAAVGVV